ncbi:hypothetical protein [Sphingobium sp. TomTYG75]
MLRQLFPDARIIHELVLRQGGVRIDIAAVRPGYIAALEIKSERDVLTRLPNQVKAAMEVTDLFGVCVAAKHADKIGKFYDDGAKVKLPWGAQLLVEADNGFDLKPYDAFHHEGGWRHRVGPRLCNPADRLEMLWAEELKLISQRPKLSRQPAKTHICESMTGRQIREAVCATLRARPFPRADPAIPFPALVQAA